MRQPATVALCGVALVLGGCGSEEPHYTLQATRSCLDERGYKTRIQDNWVFDPSEGSLVVEFDRRWVVLNFGKTDKEARIIRDSAYAADETLRSEIKARANVVYGWSAGAESRREDVLRCLR